MNRADCVGRGESACFFVEAFFRGSRSIRKSRLTFLVSKFALPCEGYQCFYDRIYRVVSNRIEKHWYRIIISNRIEKMLWTMEDAPGAQPGHWRGCSSADWRPSRPSPRGWREKGVRLAQTMPVGLRIPVRIQLYNLASFSLLPL